MHHLTTTVTSSGEQMEAQRSRPVPTYCIWGGIRPRELFVSLSEQEASLRVCDPGDFNARTEGTGFSTKSNSAKYEFYRGFYG